MLPSQGQTIKDPVRSVQIERSVLLFAGRSASIEAAGLPAGTPVEAVVSLEQQTAPRSGGSVSIHWEGLSGTSGASVSDSAATAWIVGPPVTQPARLILIAEGELGDLYSLKVILRPYLPGRMPGVEFIRSPNQGLRPFGAQVNCVVVHATVIPTQEATVGAFLRESSQVSAHYVVGKDGRIVQMVEDTDRAWHAGVSELEGVKGVNDFSVGIEIVNLNDGVDHFTDAQYAAVAAIIRHVRETNDVPDSRIVSHAFVARPLGRKNDPVGFDFKRLLSLAR